MSIGPFTPPPAVGKASHRARYALISLAVALAAALAAYGISPEVRHAINHAAHAVRRSVSELFDHDRPSHRHGSGQHHRSRVGGGASIGPQSRRSSAGRALHS